MDRVKLIVEDSTLDTGKIYLGTYTFVINDALPKIEPIDCDDASEKKLNRIIPDKR